MKVTNVSVRKLENNDSKLKGYATVILDDCLAIHDIKVVEGKDRRFISFPSKKAVIDNQEKYYDYVHPVVQALREDIESAIFNEFDK